MIGYRAQKHADILDIDRVGAYRMDDYWDKVFARKDNRLILDPGEFYILASQERLHIPRDLAAEMVPIDPAMGEFRVHYAGFFDPGFGAAPDNRPGARAVLEVRSHEVPFILEDGGGEESLAASSTRKWPSRRKCSMAKAMRRIIKARD